MRWLSSILIALLLVSPLYNLKVANADLNLPYLANYTPPHVIKAQLSGLYVTGGGLYVSSTYREQPPVIYFERPRLSVGCGAIDAFMGSIGFVNFDWLTSRLQQFLMAAPYVTFKVGLAVLLPQLDSILSSVEAIINQLNSLQIDQCGRITGLDVKTIQNSFESLKKSFSDFSVQSIKDRANQFMDGIRSVGSALSSEDPNISVWTKFKDAWNNLINDVWAGFRSRGLPLDPNERSFSLVKKTHKKLRDRGVAPYFSRFDCFYYALVGDIRIKLPSDTSGNQLSKLPEVEFYPSFKQFPGSGNGEVSFADSNLSVLREYLEDFPNGNNANRTVYFSVPFDGKSDPPRNEEGELAPCSEKMPFSALSGLDDFRVSKIRQHVHNIYNAIVTKQPIWGNTGTYTYTIQLLASIPDFPALAYIQWAAIADSGGGGSSGMFFGETFVNEISSVVSTYGACKVLTSALATLHYATIQNLNDLSLSICSRNVNVATNTRVSSTESQSGTASTPVEDLCKSEGFGGKVSKVVSEANEAFYRAIKSIDEFCSDRVKSAKQNMESVRGLAEEAEREARKRLNLYGVQFRGAIIWKN
ncbi:MAG: conjugal transfer protein TraH [Candidatus Aenigmatarchaeota archaeon]